MFRFFYVLFFLILSLNASADSVAYDDSLRGEYVRIMEFSIAHDRVEVIPVTRFSQNSMKLYLNGELVYTVSQEKGLFSGWTRQAVIHRSQKLNSDFENQYRHNYCEGDERLITGRVQYHKEKRNYLEIGTIGIICKKLKKEYERIYDRGNTALELVELGKGRVKLVEPMLGGNYVSSSAKSTLVCKKFGYWKGIDYEVHKNNYPEEYHVTIDGGMSNAVGQQREELLKSVTCIKAEEYMDDY